MTKSQFELKKIMTLKLAEMQVRNPQFSLRAFAKSLGMNPAALSEFLNGKRKFSTKLQKKIIDALNIAPDKKEQLIGLIEEKGGEQVSVERIQLSTDCYYLVSDPIYYSLLCLIETKNFKEDIEWIARRLKKSPTQITEAIKLLERVGYILRDPKGKMTVGVAHLMTTDDVANMSLRLRHAENMDNAKEALLNLPVEERYFRFETIAVGMEQMPEFKAAAQEFLDKINAISMPQEKDEVYEFCLSFFPRTIKDSACSEVAGTENATARSKKVENKNALH